MRGCVICSTINARKASQWKSDITIYILPTSARHPPTHARSSICKKTSNTNKIMSPSTSYGKREPLRILDHNQSSASAQEINKNNKSILHYETPIAGPLPSPSPPPPPSPSQSQSQYFAEATTKATAIVGAASTISVIAAPFCSDSDAYIQAFKNSRYLHSNIFFGKESLKQYCRVDGSVPSFPSCLYAPFWVSGLLPFSSLPLIIFLLPR